MIPLCSSHLSIKLTSKYLCVVRRFFIETRQTIIFSYRQLSKKAFGYYSSLRSVSLPSFNKIATSGGKGKFTRYRSISFPRGETNSPIVPAIEKFSNRVARALERNRFCRLSAPRLYRRTRDRDFVAFCGCSAHRRNSGSRSRNACTGYTYTQVRSDELFSRFSRFSRGSYVCETSTCGSARARARVYASVLYRVVISILRLL